MLLFPYRAGITTTMTEKEALDALPSLAQVLRRGLAGANEIANTPDAVASLLKKLCGRRVGDLTVKSDFTVSAGVRDGDGDGFLMDIEPDVTVKRHGGPFPCA